MNPNPLREAYPVKSLYIAIPAYTGQVSVQTAHALLGGVPLLQSAGVDVTTDFLAGCCYLDHVRNLMVERFLKSDATDLLFVDADVGFGPEALLRIAKAPRPVVAGVYPKKTPDGSAQWPLDFTGDYLASDADGLIEAAHVATGFLRINRAVFETLEANGLAPAYAHQDIAKPEARRFFHCDVRGGLYWGEDFQFCEDWRLLGGSIHIIPDLDFEHAGGKVWRGNWGQWFLAYTQAQQQADLAAPAGPVGQKEAAE